MFTPDVFGLGNPTPQFSPIQNKLGILYSKHVQLPPVAFAYVDPRWRSCLSLMCIWYGTDCSTTIYQPSVQLWPMIIYVWFLVKFCMKVILTFAQWFCPGRLSSKTTASFSISFQLLEADEAVPFIIITCNAAFGNEKYCMVGHTNFLTLFSWGKLEVT